MKKILLLIAAIFSINTATANDESQLTIINANPNYTMFVDVVMCNSSMMNCTTTEYKIDNYSQTLPTKNWININAESIPSDVGHVMVGKATLKDKRGTIWGQSKFLSASNNSTCEFSHKNWIVILDNFHTPRISCITSGPGYPHDKRLTGMWLQK